MSRSIKKFKRITQRSGINRKEVAISEARRNFGKHLTESPSAVEVQATIPDEFCVTESTRKILAMINDIALNDQRALDEKYIHVDVDENIGVGCYVRWREKNWLLTFEEVNGFDTHKTFVMKRCNQVFRFMHENQVYDIPVSATNLTLYSDGLAEGVYVSRADAKRNVKFGSNPITRAVDLGHRVMLTNKTVFKVTHMDDFSYNGLIACIVLQTAIIPEDDLVNNIAYNASSNSSESRDYFFTPRKKKHDTVEIEGEGEIFLGSEEVFKVDNPLVRWYLDGAECFELEHIDNGVCAVSVSSNSRYVGSSATLVAKVDGEEVAHKDIVIKSCF